MRATVVCVVMLAGCSSPAVVAPAPHQPARPVEPVPTPVAYVAPPLVVPAFADPKFHEVCSKAPLDVPPRPDPSLEVRPIEAKIKISPNASGPLVGFRRHGDSIRAGIFNEFDPLIACIQAGIARGMPFPFRSAMSSRQGLDFTAKLTIDPFGAARDVVVETENRADPKTIECLRAALSVVRVARRTPRETHATVTLEFIGAPPKTKIVAPKIVPRTPRYERPGCLLAESPVPIDTIELAPIEMEWLPGSWINRGAGCSEYGPGGSDLRDAVASNRVAFETCYAATPQTTGTVEATFAITPSGALVEIHATGAGDDAFHRCIETQLRYIGLPRAAHDERGITGKLTLVLEPTPTIASKIELARAKAVAATSEIAACVARTNLIGAYRANDPRRILAVDEFAVFVAASHDRKALAGCIDSSGVDTVATINIGRLSGGNDEAVERSERILAQFPELAPKILWRLGEGYLLQFAAESAMITYKKILAFPGLSPTDITKAADGYARASKILDGDIRWDNCEMRSLL